MADKKDNLELWNRVQKTDPKYTKEVGFGRKFTSINAQYQVMNATKEFGMYGKGWGIKTIDYRDIALDRNQLMMLGEAIFFAGDAEFPISSSIMVSNLDKNGNLRHDDEWAKKLETDITTKALSKLGFNADVFLGRYDDNRYVNDMKEAFATPKPVDKPKELSRAQYEAVMKALEKATESTIGGIKSKMGKYADGRYLKLAMKGISNKESNLSKHPQDETRKV